MTSQPAWPRARIVGAWRTIVLVQEREKAHLRGEIGKVRGLMPLLMKPRNGQAWTAADRAELARQLRGLSSLFPYLVVLVLPGSFALFPLLAWWLDRRRTRRDVTLAVTNPPE